MPHFIKKYGIGICLWLLVFAFLSGITWIAAQQHVAMRKSEAQSLLRTFEDNIGVKLRYRFNYARNLRDLLETYGDDLNGVAARARGLDQREGCVYLAVVKGQQMIGMLSEGNFQEMRVPDHRLDYSIQLARLVKEPVIEGPLMDPLSKRQVFLLIEPVFLDGKWWGEAVAALDAEHVMNALKFKELRAAGYQYEFWRVTPSDGHKDTLAVSSDEADFTDAVEAKFRFPTIYTLSIIPEAGWMQSFSIGERILRNFVFSLLLGTLCIFILRDKRMKKLLRKESLTDLETGFANEIGFYSQLNARIAKNTETFAVIYLQIGDYARVRPLLSAEMREGYVQHIVDSFVYYVKSPHITARLGEQCFALVLFEQSGPVELENVVKGLSLELLKKIELAGKPAILPVEYGISRYPENGSDADALLRAAIGDFERRFMNTAPLEDLRARCERMNSGDQDVELQEYSDWAVNRLARELFRLYRRTNREPYANNDTTKS